MAEKHRWQYRFANFKRAYHLLQEADEVAAGRRLSQLEQEGMIQRFEYCVELAWKVMKDYLEYQNIVFAQVTPSAVIKEAFAAKLITDGEGWMHALDARNKMSHTYNFDVFERVLADIHSRYLDCFGQLYETLAAEDIKQTTVL